MVENSPANGDARDADSVPGLGRSICWSRKYGNSLQFSCVENSLDRGAWWATFREVTKSRTHTHTLTHSLSKVESGPNCLKDLCMADSATIQKLVPVLKGKVGRT